VSAAERMGPAVVSARPAACGGWWPCPCRGDTPAGG